MKKRFFTLGILISVLAGCRSAETPPPVACQLLGDLTPPTACYTAGMGLTLTAASLPAVTNMVWVIAPLMDTVIRGGQTYVPLILTTTTNSVTIPDTIADKYPKVGVYAIQKGCTSRLNLYFSFVKRFQQTTSCFVWQQQEKFVTGD